MKIFLSRVRVHLPSMRDAPFVFGASMAFLAALILMVFMKNANIQK
jgi:hypothetical protein